MTTTTTITKNKKKLKLTFVIGNAKLSTQIAIFNLPAGHTCPFAKKCLSFANRETGKLTDGPDIDFRCYAAGEEARYPNVRLARWNNYDLLLNAGSMESMALLIQESLPKFISFIRIHSSGDFFSERYFIAWLNVAINNPNITFYAYTKALHFITKYKKLIPFNLKFTASKGGTHDHLISKHNLIYAHVVFSTQEALELNLDIDHNDSHAIACNKSFALLLHSQQPQGSLASKALSILRKNGLGGYNKKRKQLLINTQPFVFHVFKKDSNLSNIVGERNKSCSVH